MESCVTKKRLTRRAPDVWESARFSSSFLRLFIFPVGRLRRPCPSAGIPFGDDGANRWATSAQYVS